MHGSTFICLLPAGTPEPVVDALRRHFAHDAQVEVVVDRRHGERRRVPGAERRTRAPRSRPSAQLHAVALPPELAAIAPGARLIQRGPAVASAEPDPRDRLRDAVVARLEERLGNVEAAGLAAPLVIQVVRDSIQSWDITEAGFEAWLDGIIDALPSFDD